MSIEVEEILFVGVENVGKSLFIRNFKGFLNTYSRGLTTREVFLSEQTLPTVGVNIDRFSSENKKIGTITFREVGSSMSSKWTSYSDIAKVIVLVIDLSDPGCYPSSYIMLLEILTHFKEIQKPKQVAIILNKTDIAPHDSYIKFNNIFQIEELQEMSTCPIRVFFGSSIIYNSIFHEFIEYLLQV